MLCRNVLSCPLVHAHTLCVYLQGTSSAHASIAWHCSWPVCRAGCRHYSWELLQPAQWTSCTTCLLLRWDPLSAQVFCIAAALAVGAGMFPHTLGKVMWEPYAISPKSDTRFNSSLLIEYLPATYQHGGSSVLTLEPNLQSLFMS